ncbi:hypothetical protein HOLleu_19107 [Holothuria leucospilota]|uniref:Uncharacterized protein n=1 Tax=Holothuria leucospilota TaxID=206669 RepID=A0A9Q1C566_HOLLE|nr:hypothetical protein HOLleu_19107 [Holothuria leucospilota]
MALTIGTWNVRTLLDNSHADRPERKTALVARELARYRVDIAALSKKRLPDKGQMTEHGSGYAFFWSGRDSSERKEAGVGFAVRSNLVRKLPKLPEGRAGVESIHLESEPSPSPEGPESEPSPSPEHLESGPSPSPQAPSPSPAASWNLSFDRVQRLSWGQGELTTDD